MSDDFETVRSEIGQESRALDRIESQLRSLTEENERLKVLCDNGGREITRLENEGIEAEQRLDICKSDLAQALSGWAEAEQRAVRYEGIVHALENWYNHPGRGAEDNLRYQMQALSTIDPPLAPRPEEDEDYRRWQRASEAPSVCTVCLEETNDIHHEIYFQYVQDGSTLYPMFGCPNKPVVQETP